MLIPIVLGALVFGLLLLIGGVRHFVLTWGTVILQGLVIWFLRFLVFAHDHLRQLAAITLTVSIMFILSLVGLTYAVYTHWDYAVFVISLGLASIALTAFLIGMWLRPVIRLVTFNNYGHSNPYTIGCVAMLFILIAMTALGWPGAFSIITVMAALLCVMVWLHGRILNKTTVYAPHLLLICAVIVFGMTLWSVIKPTVPSEDRYLFALIERMDTVTARASVPVETDAHLSYATVTEEAHLYRVILNKEGKVETIIKQATNVPVGTVLKVWDAKSPIVYGKEPLLAVEKIDELGEAVMNTDADKEFIVARKVKITGPVIKDVEVVNASYRIRPTNGISINSNTNLWVKICDSDCTVSTTGSVNYGGETATPDGSPRMGDYTALVNGLPFGVPIAKIGENGKPFVLGSHHTIQTRGKAVFAVVNDSNYSDNQGGYTVTRE